MKNLLIYSLFITLFSCNSTNDEIKASKTLKVAPQAFNSSVVAISATPISLYAPIGADPDTLKQDLVYKIIQAPKHGLIDDHCFLNTSNNSSRSCRYISDDNFVGRDSIEYQIIDKDNLNSKTAYIDIFVSEKSDSKIISKYTSKNNKSSVDIVWVIDKSPSMLKKRHELQDSLISFTQNLKNSKGKFFDFNMAFIDSNSYKSSPNKSIFARNEEGNIFDLTSSLANDDFESFEENFAQAIAQDNGDKTSGRMIASMNTAYKGEINWFNEKANNLIYILLSNNNEMSYPQNSNPGSSNYISIKNWFYKLSQTHKQLDHFKVFPIVDFKVTKTKTSSDLYNRYHELASISRGEIFDISQKLEKTLEKIGRKVASLQNTSSFELDSHLVKKSQISIYINRKLIDDNQWKLKGNKVILNNPLKDNSYIQIQYTD